MADNTKGFTFTWKIENFSMLPHQKGEGLDSEKFAVDIWKETEWFLTLYPRGDGYLESGGYVSLYYEKIPGDTELRVNYTFALESTDSTSDKISEEFNHLAKLGFGSSNFISLDNVYEKRDLYLPNDILTIRFELSPADEISAKEKVIDESLSTRHYMTKNCILRTRIPVYRIPFMWPIENMNKRSEVQEHSIQLASVLKESPSLKMSCNWSKKSLDDYVKIEIRQTCRSPNEKRLFVKCIVTVIAADKEYQDSKESTHFFSLEPDDDVWYFPEFIKTSHMMSDKYIYIEDTLLLQCEFSFSYKNSIYHSKFNCMPPSFQSKDRCNKTKCISVEGLYMQEKFCDVHLQAGGKVFPAYKILLCARSSVFTAMFEHDMKEKNSNVIEITDVEPTTLKRMIDFIHLDDVKEELSHEDSCKLYEAADKYNIQCLKRMCSIMMTSALSVANVCNVLALADAHNDNFLMNAVHTFISTYSTETFHSNHWKTFMEDNSQDIYEDNA